MICAAGLEWLRRLCHKVSMIKPLHSIAYYPLFS